MVASKILRCAIYTRVSTDAGLEQDFNSLDAQREASEAYIKSQAHEGWRLIPTAYDDGGYSGGSMERPALQRLLSDIRTGQIDVILVYKVDRLTRSLADFAKLVEILDQHNASFVSVTQAFNTTNSMGRLTLNVLLSFAQFEREVTAERIRDKVAASKKKGIWMGGQVPLGYRVENRKLLVEPIEAEMVRMIFKRYLELGSILPLLTELHREGIKTRAQVLSTGKCRGGIPFTKGPLNYLLRNRTYIGELNHREKSYPGEHSAIVDRETFDAVQARLNQNAQSAYVRRNTISALLAGKIYDDRDNRMSPTHAKKGGAHYHYYTCRLLLEGRRAEAGTVRRVPATEVDEQVLTALKTLDKAKRVGDPWSDQEFQRQSIESLVGKVVVHSHQIVVGLGPQAVERFAQPEIIIPWAPKSGRPKREILLPHSDATKDQRPIKTEVRASVVRAVALSRRWLGELVSGEVGDIEALARREHRSKRSVHMLLSLAFVAPDIIEALIEVKLPRGIGITKLADLPLNWADQRKALGIATQTSRETMSLQA